MQKLKTVWEGFLDLLEIRIPSLLLIVMFTCFILQIFFRYFFNISLVTVNELSIITFTWLPLMAASYGSRTDTHVNFTVVYDLLPKKMKAVFEIVANLFLIICLLILIGPSWETVKFYGIKRTSIMKMSFSVLYFPFIIFILLTGYHSIVHLMRDIKGVVLSRRERKGDQL